MVLLGKAQKNTRLQVHEYVKKKEVSCFFLLSGMVKVTLKNFFKR